MNVAEAGLLLAKVAGYDNRTVGDANILAWAEALSDVDLGDALAAVAAHFRESTDWLMPVHVRRGAELVDRNRRRAERERLEGEAVERAIERAITQGPLQDRSADVRAFVRHVRDVLPAGNPDSLWFGRREWREARQRRERARTAEPNPYFDPAAARALAEMNAAELPAAPDDAPDPESEPTP